MEIKTPYIEKYDYNQLRKETTLPAIKEIYKTLGENCDLLVYDENTTNEKIKDNIAKVAYEIRQVLIAKKVPDGDTQFLITLIQDSISAVFGDISKVKYEYEKELLARVIATRDPGTSKFNRSFVTIGDMFSALEKIRKEQDKEENQYFIETK